MACQLQPTDFVAKDNRDNRRIENRRTENNRKRRDERCCLQELKGIEMVATLQKSNTVRSTTKSASAFLQVSRLGDLTDDATMEALRRAAEIRRTWSAEEVLRRKNVGQQRREELSRLLAADGS